ncbi:hypothetical protein [Mesoplasma lactucae]|uniref:Uncharacterized protein n=1 Tax=Mesoplasma lactucae ATCC 49193 TaxID=81460 RepID=A0A291IS60_9MOLU|nr:hypothetical protein [Mesoplasma lactucae]ATG97546.1 hypothetical protein CP520_02150 [Mesoplasma lactucae ATCC 49193]ATZ19995.1 hypothetical protein MLACT_v1c01730 [Mesoplasma lactucae ATCC 49193]MCL8217054.1 hypothetical protein [Mesoplasma lactucae ATCC 49193]
MNFDWMNFRGMKKYLRGLLSKSIEECETENKYWFILENVARKFHDKFDTNLIDIYSLWKRILEETKDNIKRAEEMYKEAAKSEKDDELFTLITIKSTFNSLVSIELGMFLKRNINGEKIIDFNKDSKIMDFDFWEKNVLMGKLVDILDGLNIIYPLMRMRISSLIYDVEENKFPSHFSKEELEVEKACKAFTFRRDLYDGYLKDNVDKIGFYEYYLSISRNKEIHYPSIVYSLIERSDIEEIKRDILDDQNYQSKLDRSEWNYSMKFYIILASLYIWIVYEELIKMDLNVLWQIYGNKIEMIDDKVKNIKTKTTNL